MSRREFIRSSTGRITPSESWYTWADTNFTSNTITHNGTLNMDEVREAFNLSPKKKKQEPAREYYLFHKDMEYLLGKFSDEIDIEEIEEFLKPLEIKKEIGILRLRKTITCVKVIIYLPASLNDE